VKRQEGTLSKSGFLKNLASPNMNAVWDRKSKKVHSSMRKKLFFRTNSLSKVNSGR